MIIYRDHAGLKFPVMMRREARRYFHRTDAIKPIIRYKRGVCWIVR